ncbi:MAG: DUF3667 domain-containing protein [Vicinamibacterales bacterium]
MDLHTKARTLRTLRGLLTPGWLTAEYLAGRRQRLLSPLQSLFGLRGDLLPVGAGGGIHARIHA